MASLWSFPFIAESRRSNRDSPSCAHPRDGAGGAAQPRRTRRPPRHGSTRHYFEGSASTPRAPSSARQPRRSRRRNSLSPETCVQKPFKPQPSVRLGQPSRLAAPGFALESRRASSPGMAASDHTLPQLEAFGPLIFRNWVCGRGLILPGVPVPIKDRKRRGRGNTSRRRSRRWRRC